MDFDTLAIQFRSLLGQLHAGIDAMDDSAVKTEATVLANIAHRALEKLRDYGAQNGVVQPDSGGDPKSPPAPVP
jgi:hypothetical protein